MQEVKVREILAAGGGGGIAYWAFAMFRGGLPAGEVAQLGPQAWLWFSLLLTIVLGAAAAFLMVYFVATTNTKERMKAIGFAAACGLCWDPVLAGVSDRFTREYSDTHAAEKVAEARQLAPDPAATPPAEKAADVAAELVKSASSVQNPMLKAEVVEQTEKLVGTIEKLPDTAVKASALRKVGIAAAEARQPAVLAQTMKSLEGIAASAPEHAPQAQEALSAINASVEFSARRLAKQ